MSRKYAGKDWRYMLHQEKAAASARAARASQPGEAVQPGQVPHVHTDKARITLAGLRFMGQEPHPLQSFKHEETDMPETFVRLEMPLDDTTWWKEARRAARWWWSYEELVDDAKADLDHLRAQGEDPYEAVKTIGKELDLHEFGPAWGGW